MTTTNQDILELAAASNAGRRHHPSSASVLDVCCGSRMFWFDPKNPVAIFVDKRRERHLAADYSVKNGEQEIVIDPDIVADFTDLPFDDNTFAHVIFDPPHIQRNGDGRWGQTEQMMLESAVLEYSMFVRHALGMPNAPAHRPAQTENEK